MHPSVVRVIVQDKSSRSLGSGTLVAVNESFGLVLTNWHVVRDAAAPPAVVFPDGFQSAATIARVDRDWDLAALVIWRPQVDPVPLAATPPRPGDPLAIAGYGQGKYRVDTGRCTQYLSPGTRHPFELVELTASARQGDSGGPIFNARGELAGVLFGSAFGRTTGSHSGRVRHFLAPLWNDFYRIPEAGTMMAGRPRPAPPVAAIHGVLSVDGHGASGSSAGAPAFAGSGAGVRSPAAVPAVPGRPAGHRADGAPEAAPGLAAATNPFAGSGHPPAGGPSEPWVGSAPPLGGEAAPSSSPHLEGNPSRSEQLKTILAAIGILALVFHGVRLLGRAVEV